VRKGVNEDCSRLSPVIPRKKEEVGEESSEREGKRARDEGKDRHQGPGMPMDLVAIPAHS
jgi:hypothetical protein